MYVARVYSVCGGSASRVAGLLIERMCAIRVAIQMICGISVEQSLRVVRTEAEVVDILVDAAQSC